VTHLLRVTRLRISGALPPLLNVVCCRRAYLSKYILCESPYEISEVKVQGFLLYILMWYVLRRLNDSGSADLTTQLNTSKFCSQQMHTLYFVFVRHFTSLPTCFDPCGSSSAHLMHWTFSSYYYTIHTSLYNSLWLKQVLSVLHI
jgi:hypothetical protein